MEKESLTQQGPRPINYHYSFTYSKSIRGWSEFVGTFRPMRFEQSLNHASNEEIEVFWKNHLQELQAETEKICILVPAELSKSDQKDENFEMNADQTMGRSNQPALHKTQNKQKSKAKKGVTSTNAATKVSINKKIIEIGIRLVTSNFSKLDYDYTSLFIGNQKQLLIYRKCFAVENYIEKYRLPNIKEPLSKLDHLAQELFYLKLQRNRAISTFQSNEIQSRTRKIINLTTEINQEMINFTAQWKDILKDFTSKKKCRELILNSINVEIINLLRPLCQQCETDIIDRFVECQNDQIKDILVVKKDDIRLKPAEVPIYDEEKPEKTEYRYVEPEKEPQPPKDIRNMEFLEINLANHSYTYRFQLRHADEWNKHEGIFIRSEHGEESYELNINISSTCTEINVDIHPYTLGKNSYEVYVWNSSGFTKSTQKIVFFNQLELSNHKRKTLKNYKVFLLGRSDYGLKYSQNGNKDEDQMVLFPYMAKDLSIGNAAMICDELGDVASWGQLYFPSENKKCQNNEQPIEEDQTLEKNTYRIQSPFLLLGKKYIRKVTCGTGYCLMLSVFGSMYSMGINQYGQLGQGNFENGIENTEPRQICKFTHRSSPFIVDIKASVSGASFALNSKGQVYRWGLNQVQATDSPILDRFNSIINYSSIPIIYKWCDPTKINKCFIQEAIKQVQAGNGFYFALGEKGVLYGWGLCKYLGINELYDLKEKIVLDIINPIAVMKDIAFISAGFEHVIAIANDNRVLAWGNLSHASQRYQQFSKTPIDISEEIGDLSNIKLIKAGKTFTVLLTKQDKIKIVGKTVKFNQNEYDMNFSVKDVVCGDEELIGILVGEPK